MARYIKSFENATAIQNAVDNGDLLKPYVAYDESAATIDWNNKFVDYSNMYFTILALEDGNFNFHTLIKYSINNGEWVTPTAFENTLALKKGDRVRFKVSGRDTQSAFQYNSMSFNVYGNIMSLIYEDNFIGKTDYGSRYLKQFYGCTGLVDAGNLILPATALTLINQCKTMFQGCTSLTTAPALPATTLVNGCYDSMFQGCTSLTTAPELPATTLVQACYQNMFYGCTRLTTAPELPATTLANNCYQNMFYGCTSLTTAPELPATTLASNCYDSMFRGCTSLTTASELPATTLASNCYNSMFRGCTSLTTASELPATTLAEKCYYYMFNGCTSLTYIKCLATDISASSCTNSWVNGVASSGTFVKASSMTGWTTGSSGIPNNWTVVIP